MRVFACAHKTLREVIAELKPKLAIRLASKRLISAAGYVSADSQCSPRGQEVQMTGLELMLA